MTMSPSPTSGAALKRKIAELDRVRSQMRLEIIRIQRQPGYGSEENLAETENTLIGVEEELCELVRRYEEGTSPRDSRE
ncbi:MAG: hypothetical protein NTZ04_03650 [Chloroflexi bacterium]|nr:hypothetical protein [Chloroflexota bacterium]